MPTSKQRLNLTLPKKTAVFLKKISLRDDVPQATKALELLERALEEEEEGALNPKFVEEVLRREKEDALIPFEEIIKEVW